MNLSQISKIINSIENQKRVQCFAPPSYRTLGQNASCMDWCYLRIKRNRKVPTYDFGKSHFLKFLKTLKNDKFNVNAHIDVPNSFWLFASASKIIIVHFRKCFFVAFLLNFWVSKFSILRYCFFFRFYQWISIRASPPVTRLKVHWSL